MRHWRRTTGGEYETFERYWTGLPTASQLHVYLAQPTALVDFARLRVSTHASDSARLLRVRLGPPDDAGPPTLPEMTGTLLDPPEPPDCYARLASRVRDRPRYRPTSAGAPTDRIASAIAADIRYARRDCEVTGRLAADLQHLEAVWWHDAALFGLRTLEMGTAAAHLARGCELGHATSCEWKREIREMRLAAVPVAHARSTHHHVRSDQGPLVPLSEPVVTPGGVYAGGRRFGRSALESGTATGEELRDAVATEDPPSVGGRVREAVEARVMAVHPEVAAGRVDRLAHLLGESGETTRVAYAVHRRSGGTTREDDVDFLLVSPTSPDEPAVEVRIDEQGFEVVGPRQSDTTQTGHDLSELHERLRELAEDHPNCKQLVVTAAPEVSFGLVLQVVAASSYRLDPPYGDGNPEVAGGLFPRAHFRVSR